MSRTYRTQILDGRKELVIPEIRVSAAGAVGAVRPRIAGFQFDLQIFFAIKLRIEFRGLFLTFLNPVGQSELIAQPE